MLLFSRKEPVWVFGTNENICINYCMLMMKDNYGYDDEKAGWWRHPRYSDWNPFITIKLARAPAYLMKQHLPNEMFWSDKHFRQKDEEEDDPAALVGSFKRCHLFLAPSSYHPRIHGALPNNIQQNIRPLQVCTKWASLLSFLYLIHYILISIMSIVVI